MKRFLTIFLVISFLIVWISPVTTKEFSEETDVILNQKLGTEQLKQQYAAYKLYKQKYDKPDDDDVELEYRRFTKYLENIEKIRRHNKRYERGEETYEMGINQFTDMLPDELSKLNGLQIEDIDPHEAKNAFSIATDKNLPDKIDWRDLGAVTEVMDQKNCGSSWAISAVGALEGQHFRKTGKLVPLSVQNLIDCSSNRKYGNYGCYGGFMGPAFDYVADNDGIDTEASYPYEAKQGTCRYSNRSRGATCIGRMHFPYANERQLKAAVAEFGPISVGVDAIGLDLYKGGIFAPWYCSWNINRGALVVGYGSEHTILPNGTKTQVDYWIVKNSWGKQWGEQGYYRLARNQNNTCGIATYVLLPIMAP